VYRETRALGCGRYLVLFARYAAQRFLVASPMRFLAAALIRRRFLAVRSGDFVMGSIGVRVVRNALLISGRFVGNRTPHSHGRVVAHSEA
jgi:hypothetical protein